MQERAATAAKRSSRGNQEESQAWETRQLRQPRAAHRETIKAEKLGRPGGSDKCTTNLRFRKSATLSLRSKKPYSFQLFEEQKSCRTLMKTTFHRVTVHINVAIHFERCRPSGILIPDFRLSKVHITKCDSFPCTCITNFNLFQRP